MTIADTAVPNVSRTGTWTLLSYGYGLAVALVLTHFLLGLTIQVSDSFGNLLAVQQQSLGDLLRSQFYQQGYWRPFLWAQIKIAYDVADGSYFWWFRGLHVAQVFLLIGLCIALMRPRTALDAALVPLALAVLIGAHTFAPTVREAFPINSFMTVMICCAAAASLSFAATSRWWTDIAALLLFAFVVLTVESGILVWVVCATAYLVGCRGISRRALIVMTLCVVVYVVSRLMLGVGAPSLAERPAGFGFAILEPGDIVQRFSERPWLFYGYNVIASMATVLFSEPRGGVWRFAWELTANAVHPWTAISFASSTAASILVGWYLWSRRAQLRAWTLQHDDRLVILFIVTLVANAVISYPYTKNVIMSPAGMFLAIAVFAASRQWFANIAARHVAATVLIFLVLTAGWSYRVIGTHYNLRRTAMLERNDWARVDEWLHSQRIPLASANARALRDELRHDALVAYPTPPQPSRVWTRWFDLDW